MGMLSIAQVMLIVSVTGRYGTAGVVSAAGAVLFAVLTPRIGRLADRHGQARVLRPLTVIFAATTATFAGCAVDHAPDWALIVTGALSRASLPALGPMVRSRWSQLLGGSGNALDAAFSLEGIADEVIFIAAPVLVVALVTGVQPVSGLLATLTLSLAGVAGLTRHRASEPPVRTVVHGRGTVLRSPGLRVLIGMNVCLGALFVAVDLATIAFAREHGAGAMAGPLLALYGLGSAIAGVWYGSRHWRASHSTRLRAAFAATALGVGPLAVMPGVATLAAGIFVAGLGISATLVSSYSIAEQAVAADQRTEGMSWLTTAAATGTAIGAPLAGRLVDAHGAAAGYLFAFAAGLIGLVLLASCSGTLKAGLTERTSTQSSATVSLRELSRSRARGGKTARRSPSCDRLANAVSADGL